MITEDLVVMFLRGIVHEKGLREFCRQKKIDPGDVSNILSGKRQMQKKIAEALGYRTMRMYEAIIHSSVKEK